MHLRKKACSILTGFTSTPLEKEFWAKEEHES
jgi:hypothetical protein